MEKNPDYSIVQGRYCSHLLKKRKNGEVEFGWAPAYYYGKSIIFDNPSERLKFHLSDYQSPTFYGVHRTDILRLVFKEVSGITLHGRLAEIILSGLTLIYGKMGILNVFYGSREAGSISIDRSYSFDSRPYSSLYWSSFLAENTYEEEYKRAVGCLARNLQKNTELDLDFAMETAKKSFDSYLDSVKPRLFQKICSKIFYLLCEILPESQSKNLFFKYEQLQKKISSLSSKDVKKEYCDFLEENDLKFNENLNRIKEVVVIFNPILLNKKQLLR
jgi:hypothetical protein